MATVERQEGTAIPSPWAVWAILGVCTAVLATVYAAQYLGGLEPCPLCVYQRWPWWGAAGLAALCLTMRPRAAMAGAGLVAVGLALLASAGIAAFHIGVEQQWWEGTASCAAGAAPMSFAEMQGMLARPAPRCDQPAWTLFGLSMAGYNLLASLATAGFALYLGVSWLRRRGHATHG